MLCASFTEADLPRAHLIHAGFSLPFCPPQEFPALWARIRQAVAPGGVFAGQLFGTRDTWADDPDMTFCTRHQAEVLLDGLDIFRLEETERDGHAFSGPKHWHTFDILACKRISKHPPAPAESRLHPRPAGVRAADQASVVSDRSRCGDRRPADGERGGRLRAASAPGHRR